MGRWSAEQTREHLRKQVRDAALVRETGHVELARSLREAHLARIDDDPEKEHLYVTWGYRTFEDYVRLELGLSSSYAARLIRVAECLDDTLANIDPVLRKRYTDLGVKKLTLLSQVVTAGSALEWLVQAEEAHTKDLEVAIKQYLRALRTARKKLVESKGRNPEAVPVPVVARMSRLEVPLYPSQKDVVELALEQAMSVTNNRSRGLALTLLAQEFLVAHRVDGEESRASFLRRIEELLHCRITARDFSGKVIYDHAPGHAS